MLRTRSGDVLTALVQTTWSDAMTELETKIEADEFTDELRDEALDRAEEAYCATFPHG